MNARRRKVVVEPAAMKHRMYWQTGSYIGEQTKSAQCVHREWQVAVIRPTCKRKRLSLVLEQAEALCVDWAA